MKANNCQTDRLKASNKKKTNNRSCIKKHRRRTLIERRRQRDRGGGEVNWSCRTWKRPWMHSLRLKTILTQQLIAVAMVFSK